MKILFISVYYTAFLKSFYGKHVGEVKKLNFQKHRQRLLNELFGDADFYSDGVKENGQEAEDIVVNDEILQKKWAIEKGFKAFNETDFFSKIPYLNIIFKPNWVEKILEAQIKEVSPNVLYFQDIEYFSVEFLRKIKREYFVVAQKASPVWKMQTFKQANLVFTSFPHFVPMFRANKINSEYLKLAFGKRVLDMVPKQKKIYNCTFVGGITRHHSRGNRILSDIANKEKLDIFGYGKDYLDKNSKLYNTHHGEVWGGEMYKVMMQSKMTINRHINIAGRYANNMRLFEATGSGAMLLTDKKVNINDFFEVGKETITYDNSGDLIRKIEFYTNYPKEREKIAKAGQKRTLKDHNYKVRMAEMLKLLSKYY
jgi:hypothetical protein